MKLAFVCAFGKIGELKTQSVSKNVYTIWIIIAHILMEVELQYSAMY
jgi:hypothetical protein